MFEIKGNDYNDEEKLGIIQKYNSYYNNDKKEDILKYQNLRETDIFNSINFKNPSLEFKQLFHQLNFEEMFKRKNKWIC